MRNCCKYLIVFVLYLGIAVSCSGIDDSGQVILEVGDNFQVANDLYPAGTIFLVKSGVHENQSIRNPKNGNTWIGEQGAVMDGKDETPVSFTGAAHNITIQGITIRNYTENGIRFSFGSNLNLRRITIEDSGGNTGEMNGAVRLNHMSDITIAHSKFTRVTAGILSTDCGGPVLIEWNTAINVGRNFVQLDKCTGENIKVRYNSMERDGDYLRGEAHDVVDWISIFKSEGTKNSPILVKNNRARGHGHDKTGSFIMLGDGGGQHQLATGNVGVNPGQVGIGIAGGENISVRENLMYSAAWEHSNVAFYSANYSNPHPCGNHELSNNRAFWIKNSIRQQNNIWTDNLCRPTIKNNYFPDFSINQNIWYSSSAATAGN
jgi:hypothetical protein